MNHPKKAGTVVPASNFQKKFAEKPTHTRFSRIQPHGHAHRCAPKRGRLRAPRWLSPARAHCALATLACRLTEFRWRYSYSAAGRFPGLPRAVRRARGPPWSVWSSVLARSSSSAGLRGSRGGALVWGRAARAVSSGCSRCGRSPQTPQSPCGLALATLANSLRSPQGQRSLRSR